jgi:hypothetical protein
MDDEDDFHRDDDDEIDEFDEALMNCGQMPDGSCTQAGTEYCDFECPFSH